MDPSIPSKFPLFLSQFEFLPPYFQMSFDPSPFILGHHLSPPSIPFFLAHFANSNEDRLFWPLWALPPGGSIQIAAAPQPAGGNCLSSWWGRGQRGNEQPLPSIRAFWGARKGGIKEYGHKMGMGEGKAEMRKKPTKNRPENFGRLCFQEFGRKMEVPILCLIESQKQNICVEGENDTLSLFPISHSIHFYFPFSRDKPPTSPLLIDCLLFLAAQCPLRAFANIDLASQVIPPVVAQKR